MKKLKNKIEKLKEALEARVLDREEIFDNRTEKWQESENGFAHDEETETLREWSDQLSDMFEVVENK